MGKMDDESRQTRSPIPRESRVIGPVQQLLANGMAMSIQIWVTLGPASLSETFIRYCEEKRVTLFRINLSHTPLEEVAPTIEKIQRWTDIPISLDSEGAQIRSQAMKNRERVQFRLGETVTIHHGDMPGDRHNISFTPKGIAREFVAGDRIHVDFDSVCFEIMEIKADRCIARVVVDGQVCCNKAADLERDIPLVPITDKDRRAIAIGKRLGIKNYALSFAGCREDVETMRQLTGADAIITSKIESPRGLANLEGILAATDQILIDRGDLSRRIPLHKIPFLQRRIVSIARSRRVPVMVATNLLESMVHSRQPTRAEVNDVISTLLMGAQGLVLAAETAVGRFPELAVGMINDLVREFDRWTPNSGFKEILSD